MPEEKLLSQTGGAAGIVDLLKLTGSLEFLIKPPPDLCLIQSNLWSCFLDHRLCLLL